MISVVIPTLNAAQTLPACFGGLLQASMRGLVREVVVADGGSTDETIAIADAAGAKVVHAPVGRGQQLAEGADAARSDWLLFLHADTVLEAGWEEEAVTFMMGNSLDRPKAAAFRFALDDFGDQARRLEKMVSLRCAIFGLPYGDQGLLIPTHLYRRIGGFRRISLMEDVDMVRRLGRRRLVMLSSRAVTSAERFRRNGYWRRSLRNLGILFLFSLRLPAPILARLYN